MREGRFQKELKLIERAVRTEEGVRVLREYIRPFVERAVDAYVAKRNVRGASREALLRAGWTYFPMAVRTYTRLAKRMAADDNDRKFYFDSYFNWFIKQGIREYIKSAPRYGQ